MKRLMLSTIRFTILLGLCLLLSKSSFSQSGYPKIVVIKGDTLVLITPAQVRLLNLTKVEKDRYKELNDNLQTQQKQVEAVLVNRDDVIKGLGEDIVRYRAINITNDAMEASFKRELTELQKQVKRLKLKNGLLGTLATAMAAIAAYFAIR